MRSRSTKSSLSLWTLSLEDARVSLARCSIPRRTRTTRTKEKTEEEKEEDWTWTRTRGRRQLALLFVPSGVSLVFPRTRVESFDCKYVDYTEIDWIAYGEEVDGFFKTKEYDYAKLGGQTGPLVYPAGFVYCYGLIRWMCREEVRNAQVLFAFLYVLNQWLAMRILQRSRKVPIAFYAVTCLSKRMHSIFSLRMFNDGVCAIFCHLAVLAFMDGTNDNNKKMNNHALVRGFAWLSVATSIKMNALLYLPPALVLLIGYGETLWGILLCLVVFVGIQVALALPFLLTFPKSYLTRAFELTRVFTYKWTVNFKFLNEDRFVSKELAHGLLAVHVTALFVAAHRKWFRNPRGQRSKGSFGLSLETSFAKQRETFRFVVKVVAVVVVLEKIIERGIVKGVAQTMTTTHGWN